MTTREKRLLHLGLAILLVALGMWGMNRLAGNRPAIRHQRPSAPVPVVRVMKATTGSRRVVIQGHGTVRACRRISLVPEVGGKVVYVSSSLVNGGQFSRGDVLLRIEPADYRVAVTLAEAKVKDAESALMTARESSAAAREEWAVHGPAGTRDAAPPPLVAREPQLMAARARLEAERANLEKARLNLERTELRAPFDGRVEQENVDIGQYVLPGQALGTLFSTRSAEIVVPLEKEDLRWLDVPGFTSGPGPGTPARVRAELAGRVSFYRARVVRAEGRLDEKTRMVNIVVRVERPYAGRPPLAVGLFVTVLFQGHVLPGAAVIPRCALHDGAVVWVVNGNHRLVFRKVVVARTWDDSALVSRGLNSGETIVLSPLEVVTDGMRVRIVPATEAGRP